MQSTKPSAGRARHSRKQEKFVPTPAIPEDAAVHAAIRRWRVPERYDTRSVLGSGAYGSVCEAFDREDDRMVAIKRVPRVFDDLVVAKRILREVAILRRLSDPHVVRLYDAMVPHGDLTNFSEIFLIMEIGDTDLKALMQTDIAFTPPHVKWIFNNLLCGLKYIHSVGVYHRDLKPSNVLVNADCAVKICDFGLARVVGKQFQPVTPNSLGSHAGLCESDPTSPASTVSPASATRQRVMTKHVVTRHYRAPELILLQDGYTEAIDVWSAGCIFAEMTQLLGSTSPKGRGPLFPGATCFPLSPDAGRPRDGIFHSRGRREQLNVIFDVLGTSTEEEVKQLDREDARNYIRCFAQRAGFGLQRRLPYADPDSIDLLAQMLRFGPEDRISAQMALDHRVFVGVGGSRGEPAPGEAVVLPEDEEHGLCEQDLRDRIAQEILSFAGSAPAGAKGGA